MRRFLVGLIAATILAVTLSVACGPRPAVRVDETPLPVRAASLLDSYRSFPDQSKKIYNNRAVAVRIHGGHYRVRGGDILWYATGDHELQPAMVFHFRYTLGEMQVEAIVIGKCRGRVWDGRNRGDDGFFMIEFDDCRIAPAKSNLDS